MKGIRTARKSECRGELPLNVDRAEFGFNPGSARSVVGRRRGEHLHVLYNGGDLRVRFSCFGGNNLVYFDMYMKSYRCSAWLAWLIPLWLVLVPAGSRAGAWPTNLFAPYADFTAWPPYDIVGAATNSGLRYATLAFIVADTSQNGATAPVTNLPAWGGYTAYSAASQYRLADIQTFRGLGGDVIVSFGGEAGTELAAYVTDTNRLNQAYQFVINTYGLTSIDFDIEGAAVADPVSFNRRSVVMAQLQAAAAAAGRTLNISLTLPVLPSGLDNNGLAVLRSAVSNHVNVACVNVMAMDFGDNAAPNPAGQMGRYSIMAATNLFNQMQSVYSAAGISKTAAQLWSMVGVTPLLGVNDTADEVFDQSAAGQLTGFAEAEHLGRMAFWSLNRDQPGDSGVTQTPFQFTDIFLGFAGGTNPPPALTIGSAGMVMPTNGTAVLAFPVTLVPAATNTVTVGYFTSNGSATSPGNYVATNGTLTFTAGQTAKNINVIVPGTTNAGTNLVFYLNLTNAAGASIYFPQATGTLTNENVSPGSGSGGGGGGAGAGGGASGGGGECALTTRWLVTYDNGAAFQATETISNPNATNIPVNSFRFTGAYTNIDWIDAGTMSGWVKPTLAGGGWSVGNGWATPPVIPAGGSLQLTWQGEPGGSPPAPGNLAVNGVTVGDCGSASFFFTKIVRSGTNMVLTWTTVGGTTNHLQAGSSLTGTNWTDLTGPLVISGSGSVLTNWVHVGGATNRGAVFYRLMVR